MNTQEYKEFFTMAVKPAIELLRRGYSKELKKQQK